MSDCSGCKKKESCNYVDETWFPPGAICYCRPQVLFYLENCEDIRAGSWPKEPDGSTYTDPSIRSKAVKIPALHAEQFAAEMDARIKMCGIEGKLLELEVLTERELSDTSWKALNFISGWRRRKLSYSQWKKESKYKEKTYQKVCGKK